MKLQKLHDHLECLYPLLRRWWIDIKYWMDEDYKED